LADSLLARERRLNMKIGSLRSFAWTLVALTLAGLSTASALEATPKAPKAEAGSEQWYRTEAAPKEMKLSRQRAIQRGDQRSARLEAMRWYGYSNSRPVATGIPYTAMYSPAWQQPGGRPFAWHANTRPIVIIASPVYR
jgi:hypothetical protein